MSGESHTDKCPRCGRIMEASSDWKPVLISSGSCRHCGFNYYTHMEVLSKEELDDSRADYKTDYDLEEEPEWTEFTKEELARIKRFDETWCPAGR